MTLDAPKRRDHGKSARRIPLTLQLLGAVLVVSSIIAGVFSTHASATPLTNGVVTLKVSPNGAVATTPLNNQQNVDVSVAANSTLSRSSLQSAGFPSGVVALKVLQCSDLNGQPANLPKKPTDCEPTTVQASADVAANGSFILQGYTIYALPDGADLGPSNGTTCDDGAHQCVLGIFSNQNDFTKPHLFSAPFQVVSTVASNSTGPPSTSGGSNSGGSSSGSASGGVTPGVSVPPATLADTGSPTLWPWLLGAGSVLLVVGSLLRYSRRPASEPRH